MQNIFSKIDKKILIILGVILIVVLIAGFFVYKYLKDVEKTVENNQEEAIIETSEQGQERPPVDLGNPQIEIQQQSGLPAQPGLTICVDKCGDGVCQALDPECKDSMNCICAETKVDCPGDCK